MFTKNIAAHETTHKIARIGLGLLSGLFIIAGLSGFADAWNFQSAEKVLTTAVVQIDDNDVKTYSYTDNTHPVVVNDPITKIFAKEGDLITIYYQADQPSKVYRAGTFMTIWLNPLAVFGLGMFFFLIFADKLPFMRKNNWVNQYYSYLSKP